VGRDSDGYAADLGQARSKIFLQKGLDSGVTKTRKRFARQAKSVDPFQTKSPCPVNFSRTPSRTGGVFSFVRIRPVFNPGQQ
jgi:hypothetical protein